MAITTSGKTDTATGEIVFIAETDSEAGFSARAIGESIFTQGKTLEELKSMVIDAVACHFNDDKPRHIRLILPTLELRTP
ncbi:MAG TPA: hypothetical protein PLJ62_14935, partial [Thermoflexales bacterium]|nr:hypothetical protein [Thermoflexales bacterium]HQW34865.1 hypothetical protein [Thermoflexales bacterium]HQZ23186.1 hypothetical protein [Thermoflexales bacterium]HRA01498.1 hypothetical protein [Thermoflexales bacterium]